MKLLVIAAVALLAAQTAHADPAMTGKGTGPVCLRSHDIQDTKSPNDRTIIFHMNNGAIWRNDLPASCSGLTFDGFVYDATPPDEICGHLQIIRVLRSHAVCALGPFTLVRPGRM